MHDKLNGISHLNSLNDSRETSSPSEFMKVLYSVLIMSSNIFLKEIPLQGQWSWWRFQWSHNQKSHQ